MRPYAVALLLNPLFVKLFDGDSRRGGHLSLPKQVRKISIGEPAQIVKRSVVDLSTDHFRLRLQEVSVLACILKTAYAFPTAEAAKEKPKSKIAVLISFNYAAHAHG